MDMGESDADMGAVHEKERDQDKFQMDITKDSDSVSVTRTITAGDGSSEMLLDGNGHDGSEPDDQKIQREKEGDEDINRSNSEGPEKKKIEDGKDITDVEDVEDHEFDESANEETRLQLLSASVRDQDELERMVGRQVCSHF